MKKKIGILMTACAITLVGLGNVSNSTANVVKTSTEVSNQITQTAAKVDAPVLWSLSSRDVIAQVKSEASSCISSIDISGCESFQDIIDKKLTKDMGYTNTKIGSTDVLLVAKQTYTDKHEATAAIIYGYRDGRPVEIGRLCSGGTADPLKIKDGYLYVGTHHTMSKYTIRDNKLILEELAVEEFSVPGTTTYHYYSENPNINTNIGNAELQKKFDQLFRESGKAKVINFKVKK